MARTAFNVGPGFVEVGPGAGKVLIYSPGDITVSEAIETEVINSAMFGPVDEIVMNRAVEVDFTPIGELESASIYLPYQSSVIGSDLFPQTDETLIIRGADLTKRTYSAAALMDYPQISLATGKSIWGPMKYLCLGTGDALWSSTNNLMLHETAQALPSHTLASAALKRNVYTAAWGTKIAPFNAMKSIDGFTINAKISTADKSVDSFGLVNKYITGFSVEVTFSPVGLTELNMTTIQTGADPRVPFFFQGTGGILGSQKQGGASPYNAARGMSLAESGANLVITGGTTPYAVTATVKNAVIKKVEYDWSTSNPRVKSITMVATNTVFGGAMSDLFTLAIA